MLPFSKQINVPVNERYLAKKTFYVKDTGIGGTEEKIIKKEGKIEYTRKFLKGEHVPEIYRPLFPVHEED